MGAVAFANPLPEESPRFPGCLEYVGLRCDNAGMGLFGLIGDCMRSYCYCKPVDDGTDQGIWEVDQCPMGQVFAWPPHPNQFQRPSCRDPAYVEDCKKKS